ncbi:MAG: hypothetical protein WBD09_00975 [Halobacteriota archaeon]
MKKLKINHSWILVLIVVGTFFLMPLSVSASDAKEETSLPKSPFVSAEIKNIGYDRVSETEMIKNCSEVSIKVVLTNVSKEIEESTLIFYSELTGAGGHISVDGEKEALQSGGSYKVEHKEVEEEIVISWSGAAPEVGKQETFTLLNIKHETTEGKYAVVDIEKDVSSEAIKDALNAWHKAKEEIDKANWTIINATEDGVDVSDAKTTLDLANEHLRNSLDSYNSGRPGEALEEAELAEKHAKEAELKARAVIELTKYRTYSILVVVAGIVIAALIFLRVKRGRKRGIY